MNILRKSNVFSINAKKWGIFRAKSDALLQDILGAILQYNVATY